MLFSVAFLVTRRGFEPRTHCLKGIIKVFPDVESSVYPLEIKIMPFIPALNFMKTSLFKLVCNKFATLSLRYVHTHLFLAIMQELLFAPVILHGRDPQKCAQQGAYHRCGLCDLCGVGPAPNGGQPHIGRGDGRDDHQRHPL